MLSNQSHLFQLPDEITYLNCAYMSPMLQQVATAGIQGMESKFQPHSILPPDFFTDVQRLKAVFAQLIGCPQPERIAIMPSVSYGIASAAANTPMAKGSKLILAGEQFPSNYYSWERIAQQKEAQIEIIAAPPILEHRGETWSQQIIAAIDEHTAAVAISHVHWADGTRFDLAAIRERTREVGALLLIDGTQSVGALPFDIARFEPDALVCGTYKWLMGPYGLALAYMGPAFDGGQAIEENWINRKNSEDFRSLVSYEAEYQPAAGRYSMGEQSNFITLPMAIAGIEQILKWQVGRIQEYCRDLQEPFLAALPALGAWTESLDWRGSHLFGIRFDVQRVNVEKLQEELRRQQIIVSWRGDAIRISLHLYNQANDLEKLLACIRAAQV